jgi:uncharacterized protein
MRDVSTRPADGGSTDGTATVCAVGAAVVRVAPDQADLSIVLSALAPVSGEALADVTRRSEELGVILDELSVTRSDRSIGVVSVAEEFEHSQAGRRSVGYRASGRALVRSGDAELIGRLITGATERIQAQIDGPRWQVSASNPARLQAAREASGDARRKAEAFAEGLGARLGRVLRVLESADAPQAIRRLATRSSRAPAGREPGVPIEAGEHDVVSTVEVTFALEET